MKHFKLVGPETTREFDIEEDEMVLSHIVKMSEYEIHQKDFGITLHELDEQNVKIYKTEKS